MKSDKIMWELIAVLIDEKHKVRDYRRTYKGNCGNYQALRKAEVLLEHKRKEHPNWIVCNWHALEVKG